MFLIKRTISPYTHHDVIIGMFDNHIEAIKQRDIYIQKCQLKDEWSEQAYHDIDLEKDIVVENVSNLIHNNQDLDLNQLFVVSLFEEGFGQLIRKIEAIYASSDEAEEYITEKEIQGFEYEPSYYEIETIIMNTSGF